MSNPIYIKNVGITGVGAIEGAFHFYDGTIQSGSLNKRYFFRISNRTLRSIQEQANAGTHVYPGHRTYGQPLGKSVNARLYGGKVNSQFFVQAGLSDVNSDDHIRRLDSGVTDALSTGFMMTDESKIMCDLCENEEMEAQVSWFSLYWECQNGHRLGRIDKATGKRVTGELQGPVDLKEFSIVATGADPEGKVLKKIREEVKNGDIDLEHLNYIAEAYNLSFNNFCNSLSTESGLVIPGWTPPNNPKPTPNGGGKVAKDLLEQENEQLTQQVEQLTAQLAELENNYTSEEYESLKNDLEQQLETAKAEVETYKTKAQENEQLAAEGKLALEFARKRYRKAFISSCGNNQLTPEELEDLDTRLESNNSIAELQKGIDRLLKQTRENRASGPRSQPTEPTPVKNELPKNMSSLTSV